MVWHELGWGGVRRRTDEKLKAEDAKSPVINSLAVALLEDELGREILGCAAQRPRA